jgi:hypothetical protein
MTAEYAQTDRFRGARIHLCDLAGLEIQEPALVRRPTASLKAHVPLIGEPDWGGATELGPVEGLRARCQRQVQTSWPRPSGVLQILTTERECCEYDENDRQEQRSQYGPQDRDVLPGRQRGGRRGEGRR